MVILAMFIALSIVLGKQLSITVGAIRLSFENLPILMAGIFFGPLAGALVGGCADIVGCLVVGYSINPIVTFGAISIGFISGFVYRSSIESPKLRLMLSVGIAHVVGSMVIKSIGLYVYYHYAVPVLLLRVPLYLVIGSLETLIVYTLLESKAFQNQLSKITD
jgi:ECF transporter S component (folate family)